MESETSDCMLVMDTSNENESGSRDGRERSQTHKEPASLHSHRQPSEEPAEAERAQAPVRSRSARSARRSRSSHSRSASLETASDVVHEQGGDTNGATRSVETAQGDEGEGEAAAEDEGAQASASENEQEPEEEEELEQEQEQEETQSQTNSESSKWSASATAKISSLWQFFAVQADVSKAKWRECGTLISRGGSDFNNGGLASHLKRKHPELFELYSSSKPRKSIKYTYVFIFFIFHEDVIF